MIFSIRSIDLGLKNEVFWSVDSMFGLLFSWIYRLMAKCQVTRLLAEAMMLSTPSSTGIRCSIRQGEHRWRSDRSESRSQRASVVRNACIDKKYGVKPDAKTLDIVNTIARQKEIVVLMKTYGGDAREKLCEAINKIPMSFLIIGNMGLGTLLVQPDMHGVFFHDPAILYSRAADLHDRHRDMRLDVDNMSYEELLALTERIGNVSIGLTDETILKCLKQRKYISLSEETPSEVEPCCICQEEYVEEDDVDGWTVGMTSTACIKQWPTMKNLCPICKTTGLVESSER